MNRKQIQRFQKFIELDLLTGCWLWKGCLTNGYGIFKINRKNVLAHRASFVHWNGDIPQGLEIDHLCRNRICCNPKHLESVTHKENVKRGNLGIINKSKTHCKHGHEFNKDNTIITKGGSRNCRICVYLQNTNSKLRLKCR